MLRAEDLFSHLEDTTMFYFCFARFTRIVESYGKTVPAQQGIGMRGSENPFFQAKDVTKACDRLIILSGTILRISQAGPAPQGVGMLRAQQFFPSFDYGAQDIFGFSIVTLI